MRAGASPSPLATPQSRRALDALRGRSYNFSVERPPTHGASDWAVDEYCQALPAEPPGPPVAGGSWQIAQRLTRDYEFADPRIVRAVYYDVPLQGRDMLLVVRFCGLRFRLGVRVSGLVDEQRLVAQRPVRIWGWDYRTLQGHFEAGQMDYEVWKWLDSGEVEFRISRFVRTGRIANPLIRLGWTLFGRWMQVRFARRACQRMAALVAAELGLPAAAPPRAADVVKVAPLAAGDGCGAT